MDALQHLVGMESLCIDFTLYVSLSIQSIGLFSHGTELQHRGHFEVMTSSINFTTLIEPCINAMELVSFRISVSLENSFLPHPPGPTRNDLRDHLGDPDTATF